MRDKIADKLRGIYESRNPCDPIRNEMDPLTLEEAYEIQQANTHFWLDSGRRLVGRKIGLTSKIVQKQVGVDQPDFGMLYADMGYGSGDEVDYNLLIQPKVESEICLVLQRDLTFSRHNIQDIIDATAYALPSIEIVDSRIKDWDIKIYDTIADNASSAMFVLGSRPVKLSKLDLEMCGMSMEINGHLVSSGAGMACLGNPLNAAIWLADKCVEIGMPLKAGDIVMTGALGPFVNVNPGDSVRTKIEGLGEVRIHFTN